MFEKTQNLFLFLALIFGLALALALWITWNPPGAGLIEGLQGRIFIPLAPLALLPFYNRNPRIRLGRNGLNRMVLTAVSPDLCWTLAVLFRRYDG